MPGEFRVVLVDDQIGRRHRRRCARGLRSEQLDCRDRRAAAIWLDGKIVGDEAGRRSGRQPPDFLWFTDADIAHAPDTLASLVARAEAGNKVLVSLMARLQLQDHGGAFPDSGLCVLFRHALSRLAR